MRMEKRCLRVNGLNMAYVERGQGQPLIFLHGNPTSSFLWRNIIAPLSDRARCIAPDLIGMGDSDRLPESDRNAYTFAQHSAFLDAFIEQLGLEEPVVLVLHDWGSVLGFDWARRHPEQVRGIVYMEAIVGVMQWGDWSLAPRLLFRAFRSPLGEYLVLRHNLFVKRVLPAGVLRVLAPDEQAEYERPFAERGEARRTTLSWPRQLPVDGEPSEICRVVEAYAEWLAQTEVPKLFLNAEPGRILVGSLRESCRRFPNQQEVTVRGDHYVQEDSPSEIAHAIAAWLERAPRDVHQGVAQRAPSRGVKSA